MRLKSGFVCQTGCVFWYNVGMSESNEWQKEPTEGGMYLAYGFRGAWDEYPRMHIVSVEVRPCGISRVDTIAHYTNGESVHLDEIKDRFVWERIDKQKMKQSLIDKIDKMD